MKEKHINYFIKIASETAKLSTAEKLKVGAIIVKDDRIISIGYNGTFKGFDNKCEDENGHTFDDVFHAEENAILKLAKSSESGDNASIFISHSPCWNCAKMIAGSGIKRVVFESNYKDLKPIAFLKKCGVEVIHYNNKSHD